MDCDDNDSRCNNLQLAGEGYSKSVSVFRPYVFPKFDFDDSLQGHLKFDSLVETEVFHGIQGQEDNQWIDQFSRGSDRIEFSSGAPGSCSVTRQNNVWSEATSLESVEMLLRSVGHEQTVPAETIIEKSNTCGELGSLINKMEPNYCQDIRNDEYVTNLNSKLPQDDLRKELKGDLQGEHLKVENTSVPQEKLAPGPDNSSHLGPGGSTLTEGNHFVASESDFKSGSTAEIPVNESLDCTTAKDSSARLVAQMNPYVPILGSSDTSELENDLIPGSTDGLPTGIVDGGSSQHVSTRKVQTGIEILDCDIGDASSQTLDNLVCYSSDTGCVNLRKNIDTPAEPGEALSQRPGLDESDKDGCISQVHTGKDGAVILPTNEGMPYPFRNSYYENLPLSDPQQVSVLSSIDDAADCVSVERKKDSSTQVVSCQVSDRENGPENSSREVCLPVDSYPEPSLHAGNDHGHSVDQCKSLRNVYAVDPCHMAALSSSAVLTETGSGDLDTSEVEIGGSSCNNKLVPSISVPSKQVLLGTESVRQTGDSECDPVTSSVKDDKDGSETFSVDVKDVGSEEIGTASNDLKVKLPDMSKGNTDNEVTAHELRPEVSAQIEPDNDVLPSEKSDEPATIDCQTEGGERQPSGRGLDPLVQKEETTAKDTGSQSMMGSDQVANDLFATSDNVVHCPHDSRPSSSEITGKTSAQSVICNVASDIRSPAILAASSNRHRLKELQIHPNCRESVLKEGNVAKAIAPGSDDGFLVKMRCHTSLYGADSKKSGCGSPTIISSSEPCQYHSETQETGKSDRIKLSGKKLQSPTAGLKVKDGYGDDNSFTFKVNLLPESVERENGENWSPLTSIVASKSSPVVEGPTPSRLEKTDSTVSRENPGPSEKVSEPKLTHEPSKVNSLPEMVETENGENWSPLTSIVACKSSPVSEGPTSSRLEKTESTLSHKSPGPSPKVAECRLVHGTSKFNSLPETAERENCENWSSLTSIVANNSSPVVEGPTPSRLEKTESTLSLKNPGPSPKVSEGELAHGTSKSNLEHRVRRASVKGSGKEKSRKGNHGKETTPDKPSVKPEKISNDSSSSSCSTPHAFQKPFTDMQQVQLRAQIFVYGSIIQGDVPEEACMVSAFGPSDGGRSIWEPLWQAAAERVHNQKAPSVAETHLQSHSGAGVSDLACKPGHESKVLPSPFSPASNTVVSASVVSSIIPLSSPLWSMTTPSRDGLRSGVVQRVPMVDYQHTVSPVHPYQIPSLRNVVSPTSWPSQAPLPVQWSPQASSFINTARFSTMPMTETVKLTAVKDSVVSAAPVTKHITSSPVVNTVGLTPVFSGTSQLVDPKKAILSPEQPSADPKPRKRKKVSAADDLDQVSMPAPAQTEPRKRKKVPASDDLGQVSMLALAQTEPVVESLTSSSLVATSAPCLPKVDWSKSVTESSPLGSIDFKRGHTAAEKTMKRPDETLTKVAESQLHAKDAATLAASAASRCQEVWDQLAKQKEAGLTSEVEAQIASTAVAIAAAASVAKAAAAAACVASNAALQAKLMADEALLSGRQGSFSRSDIHVVGEGTLTTILKGDSGTNQSNSILVAAREAARSRLEAASAASKQAENLDAVVRAAELAVEAVSQAGQIVAMGNPFPLNELIKAGPEGYWRLPQPSNELAVKLSDAGNANEGVHKPPKTSGISLFSEGNVQIKHDKAPPLTEGSSASLENSMRSADDISGASGVGEKELRCREDQKTAEMYTSDKINLPEAELEISIVQEEHDTGLGASDEINMKEGDRVEVFKDNDGFQAAWFSADVLSIKDGRAYVCFVGVISDEGSGNLKEWVALYGEGDRAPRIRNVHPHFEGNKKRHRSAMRDYVWAIGDRVDVRIQDCWWEGVVKEKKEKDDTRITVEFPARRETSTVRTWQLRPSRIWNDGKWILYSRLREFSSSCKGDTPREKRQRLGSPPVASGVDKVSGDANPDTGKPEGSRLLPLSSSDKVFNIGKSAREVSKPGAHRTLRTGLQKERSKVVIGVPKPGKKQKFMEVSKQYSEDRSMKKGEAGDAVKFAKYLVPQAAAASRGWKNSSKINSKEKQHVDKPKAPSICRSHNVGRTASLKTNFMKSTVASRSGTNPDHNENTESVGPNDGLSKKQALTEHVSSSGAEEAEGPLSSLFGSQLECTSKKATVSNPKAQRLNKGKVRAAEKLTKTEEDKICGDNGGKSMSEAGEPRRSNRRIQPTHRLLEGLQSSMLISKIPSSSNDKGYKSQRSCSAKGGK